MTEMVEKVARALCDANRNANGWMPIDETVQDSSVWCPVWVTNGHSMRVAFWAEGEEYENHGSKGGGWRDWFAFECGPQDLHFLPTHWQPTPQPLVQP